MLNLDAHKLAWHRDRLDAYLAGDRVAPVTIDCALTRRCNLRCVYCYGQLQENPGGPLSWPEIASFLDDAAQIGVRGISFVSDGESTCSPHLPDAVQRAAQNGLSVALGTNLVIAGGLDRYLEHLDYLRVNISAGTPEAYAKIHGTTPSTFHLVLKHIRAAVQLRSRLPTRPTIGLQMVLLPQYADQVLPLAKLGAEEGVDYLIIKHCSDDEKGSLAVDYSQYFDLGGILRQAEALSTPEYQVAVKWAKLLTGNHRRYQRCYGPPLQLQLSGSGLVAPCGMLFHPQYQEFHIGSLHDASFKAIWESERYWEVMRRLATNFDARTQCGCLCLQHAVCDAVYGIRELGEPLPEPQGDPPPHRNFL